MLIKRSRPVDLYDILAFCSKRSREIWSSSRKNLPTQCFHKTSTPVTIKTNYLSLSKPLWVGICKDLCVNSMLYSSFKKARQPRVSRITYVWSLYKWSAQFNNTNTEFLCLFTKVTNIKTTSVRLSSYHLKRKICVFCVWIFSIIKLQMF